MADNPIGAAETGNEDPNPVQEEERSPKRPRSSDFDLTVKLKYKDDNGNDKEKEYKMYGQILSSLSKFVDASLTIEMRE